MSFQSIAVRGSTITVAGFTRGISCSMRQKM
jgi:hypothetical protein